MSTSECPNCERTVAERLAIAPKEQSPELAEKVMRDLVTQAVPGHPILGIVEMKAIECMDIIAIIDRLRASVKRLEAENARLRGWASDKAVSAMCAILAGGSRERVVIEVLQKLKVDLLEQPAPDAPPQEPAERAEQHCPTCICGRRAPVQGDRKEHGRGTIAWDEHLRAHSAYAAKWGRGQSAERLAERGGFCWDELIGFLGGPPKTWQPQRTDKEGK